MKPHGSPLGEAELKAAKENLGWPVEPAFLIPPEALARFRQAVGRGQKHEEAWQKARAAYAKAFPSPAIELKRTLAGELPSRWQDDLPAFSE